MLRRGSGRLWASVGVLCLVPLSTAAQAPGPTAADGVSPKALEDYFTNQELCLGHYRFGSVTFDVTHNGQRSVFPGETVRIQGFVRNTNEYPLPHGRILARILRQDARVAAEHWHPVVGEIELPGDYALPANGAKPFAFARRVPSRAPAGLYRVEFTYLAGQRFVFAGIPYVTNVTGGSVLFEVRDGGFPGAVTLDRGSVLLNGSPLALRATPPTLPATSPVTVEATLRAEEGIDAPMPVTVRSALYEWSDTDGEPPLLSRTQTVILKPGEPVALPFRWDTPRPGTYELILTAVPADHNILSSVLRVRFPVEGYVPRLLYAGIGSYDAKGNAVVVACATNGTNGDGTGRVAISAVTGAGSTASTSTATEGTDVTTAAILVPESTLASGLTIRAEARDAAEQVTDQSATRYTPTLLAGREETKTPVPVERAFVPTILSMTLALALALAGTLLVSVLRHRRRLF